VLLGETKMTLDEWIVNGEVGVSSKTMWSAIKGVAKGNEQMGWNFDTPSDPDDFRRCYLFYKQCNLTKEDLQTVAKVFKWYKPFMDAWDEMVKLYEEESPKRSCPKLYARMEELNNEARTLDGWVQKSPNWWERKKATA
jgi:hypothetical protein